jgi:hypothetical protein
MKKIIPQFELPGTADCFNLSGEVLIQQHHAKIHRADDTPELPMDDESQLRNLLSAKRVHPVIQARVITTTARRASVSPVPVQAFVDRRLVKAGREIIRNEMACES